MFTPDDLKQLNERGITPASAEAQIHRFETGFPFLKLAASATPGHGITVLTPELEQEALVRWQQYLNDGGSVAKFVPASGAASRMFKALFAFVNGSEEKAAPGSPVAELLDNLDRLPFIKELNEPTQRLYGEDARTLLE
ncbi:MAG: DUF4301 family protein, partial [Muribaculaceae bacterium]|nr:DUF4301 family protein [Muribaculaceae bacterium]